MKKFLVFFLSAAAACQAALVSISLSPPGTDVAVGLSPSNEVPAVTNSTGSGGAISGGLVFDTDTRTLTLAVGYGSAAGFTDLTGPATSITLHGPATTNQTAGVLLDLSAINFAASNAAEGGVIYGSVVFPTNDVADLLAGLDYLNLGTAANPEGELRGQLIVLAPLITCPEPQTVECGTPAVVPVTVSSPSGSALTVVWSLNGIAVQTNQIPAGPPPVTTNVVFTAELPTGTNVLDLTVTDAANNSAACSTIVTVVDNTPPEIQSASASPDTLWPPNHKMVTVTVKARVTDNCDAAPGWKIIHVTSNEPVNGLGDGNTFADWQILSDHTVALRAERAGAGSGRIYTLTIQARDAAGNLSEPATVTVTVVKSQGRRW